MRFNIILPTIGRDSLSQTVASVLGQDYDNWRLFIIGDGINIETLHPYFEMDGRIEASVIVERGYDSGAWARNSAILQGHSEWIAYIDDDDVWLPSRLSTIVHAINNNPGVNMVRTAGQPFYWKHKSPRSSKLVRKLGQVNDSDIFTVGMAHTRELFKKTKGWQPGEAHDRDLWNEMLRVGGNPFVSDIVTFEFER